jgi:hypothetical protein
MVQWAILQLSVHVIRRMLLSDMRFVLKQGVVYYGVAVQLL